MYGACSCLLIVHVHHLLHGSRGACQGTSPGMPPLELSIKPMMLPSGSFSVTRRPGGMSKGGPLNVKPWAWSSWYVVSTLSTSNHTPVPPRPVPGVAWLKSRYACSANLKYSTSYGVGVMPSRRAYHWL